MKVFGKLWRDADGFVVSSELILIATVVVIGLLTGLAAVRDAVISELSDVAGAIQDINEAQATNGVHQRTIEDTQARLFDPFFQAKRLSAASPFSSCLRILTAPDSFPVVS